MNAGDYTRIFRKILRETVNADKKSNITLLYDELFHKYFDAFSEVINKLRYRITYIFVPYSYQCVLQNNSIFYANQEIQLPAGINASINQSDIVLNFLTGNSNSSKVRGAVITYIKDKGCKVVHFPHVSDEALQLISMSSYTDIHKDCELLAWSLGNAETAVIRTRSPLKEPLELHIKLGSWSNDPFISSGIIYESSWGNITPGEAFCCPKSSMVNGKICINGSVSGRIFDKDEYLLLTFVKGKVTEWTTKPDSSIHNFMMSLQENSKKFKDKHWNAFAELGIGLNQKIKKLTGNPVFDEKMAGTVHIAIGDNVCFGHPIQSHTHEDMVIKNSTLLLDEFIVIENGKLKKGALANRRQSFKPPSLSLNEDTIINFKQAKIHFDVSGIKRKLNRGSRIGHISILSGQEEKKSLALKEIITRESHEEIAWPNLLKKTKKLIEGEDLKNVIEAMVHYRMASIK